MSTWMAFGFILGTFWSHFWTLWAPVTNFSDGSAALEKRQQKVRKGHASSSVAGSVGPLKQLEA